MEQENNGLPTWERKVLEDLAFEAIKEKRRARRWNILFRFLFLGYLVLLLWALNPDKFGDTASLKLKDHTALVELDGLIAPGERNSADNLVTGLRKAFEDKHTKGVILRINSPGGSPVQSSYVNKEILRLREKYPDIPLYAVVSDLCASGGYYIAVAADKIYVDESSLIGSIGVRMDGFGFVDAMDKLGVERRLLTAGEHKGILDPFSPVVEYERDFVQGLLDDLHQEFIQRVKDGRGERLKGDQDQLFSGLFWTGGEAIKLGLADEIGSASQVARDVIGAEDIVDFTHKEKTLDRLIERLGAGAASAFGRLLGVEQNLPVAR